MKAITPAEAEEKRVLIIPGEVYEAFNELITRSISCGFAIVKQKDVINLIIAKLNVSSDHIFKNNWLDIEDEYRKVGWKVEYEKPAYCETFDAYFRFSKKG